ncbi:TPA: hypothetical protein EYN98_21630 [Candidatus Poribacteria bacterium]|nr:hypothetical protein [Candidatus Poribacteria bacterium]
MRKFEMTYENYTLLLETALEMQFVFLTYTEYFQRKECNSLSDRIFIMRHDVDMDNDVEKSTILAEIESD